MSRQPLRRPTSLFGAHGRRIIVVLLVVAVGTLLAVPATAGAHVDKKHKARYARTLTTWRTVTKKFQRAAVYVMNNAKDKSDQMAPLVLSQDPNDQAQLHALEASCGVDATSLARWMKHAKPGMNKAIAAYLIGAEKWFSHEADREALASATDDLATAYHTVFNEEYGEIISALKDLANGDIFTADAHLIQADLGSRLAAQDFEEALANLKKLL